jgi:hypothetical protein
MATAHVFTTASCHRSSALLEEKLMELMTFACAKA